MIDHGSIPGLTFSYCKYKFGTGDSFVKLLADHEPVEVLQHITATRFLNNTIKITLFFDKVCPSIKQFRKVAVKNFHHQDRPNVYG